MRERWFGATGRRVPEIALESEMELNDALVLDDVSDAEALKKAHDAGRPVVVRAGSADAVKAAFGSRAEAQSNPSPVQPGAQASAPKRVVLKIVTEKVISWDHTKLGGKY